MVRELTVTGCTVAACIIQDTRTVGLSHLLVDNDEWLLNLKATQLLKCQVNISCKASHIVS